LEIGDQFFLLEYTVQIAENKPVTIEWGFLRLFVLYSGILVGMAEIVHDSMPAFREFTTSAVTALWGLFSVPVSCSGTQLTFVGFPMEVVLECTALHYMIIFNAGVLAFRSHTLPYRITGIIIGTMTIFLLNIVRIGVIGFIGRYFNPIFGFVHDYLWQGLFALSVLLIWIIWINGKKILSNKFIVPCLLVSVSASLSFWLTATFLDTYVALLAALSNIMFQTMSFVVDVPQHVVSEGRLLGYVVGNDVIHSKVTLYAVNAALLLPVASITFVRSQAKLFLKRLSAASVLLVLQHMLIIVLDWMLEVFKGPGIQSVFIWGIVMSTFMAPMLIWLLVMKIFRAEPATDSRLSLR